MHRDLIASPEQMVALPEELVPSHLQDKQGWAQGISSAPHPIPRTQHLPWEGNLGWEVRIKLQDFATAAGTFQSWRRSGVKCYKLVLAKRVLFLWCGNARQKLQHRALYSQEKKKKKKICFAVLFSLRGCGGERQKAQHLKKVLPELQAEGWALPEMKLFCVWQNSHITNGLVGTGLKQPLAEAKK